jgi:predicted phosphoribosyltransferase/dienelactone hydrolase
VAGVLNDAGFATLLMDLLTIDEEEADRYTGDFRFNIPLLAERLAAAADWLSEETDTKTLPLGLFGASTGGGAALVAAADRPERVRAVVSRGGRPDLAGDALPWVTAATLLIVGERDPQVLEVNRGAARRMTAARPVELTVVAGATHLFEEPGALETVARLAADWFGRRLAAPGDGADPPDGPEPPYADRSEAGRVLSRLLTHYRGRGDVLVLGLPRGGVPVADEVARALGAPLDVFVVRKLGVPGHEELAMGAVASGGIGVLNEDVVDALRIPPEAVERVAERESEEMARREAAYRGDRPFPPVAGRVVILVDDGLATGATMRAAVRALRTRNPARIVVAVPVADPEVCAALEAEADEVICARLPRPLGAVGLWYEDFSPTSDDEVRRLLAPDRPA